jgi:hypothetical protein
VAKLFVTKTVYAAIIAVAVGLAGITYPFFPRHLTIISTLTIGVPGFFLALAPGAPLARPGFTRRVLAFTVPAGTAAAAAGWPPTRSRCPRPASARPPHAPPPRWPSSPSARGSSPSSPACRRSCE